MIDSPTAKKPDPRSPSSIAELTQPRTSNIIKFVATPKKSKKESHSKDPSLSQANLIRLTERLAEDAKNGILKGIGGFAEYVDGYTFGLEGSYLVRPDSAVLPLSRLQYSVMQQIQENEENEAD